MNDDYEENILKSNKWRRSRVLWILKVEIQKVDQIIQSFCRIGSPKKLRPSLFDLRKFYKSEKRTSESFKIYPNVMNGEEFRSFKFLKLSK